jgi:CubicO group peptidase (beta-lactamase class C family)
MADLRTTLRAELTEGRTCSAIQAHVRRGDRVLFDFAEGVDGAGEPVGPDTIFATYCLTKPVIATAIAHLVADGALAIEDRLAAVLPVRNPDLARVTLAMLLAHTAGLHGKQLRQFAIMPSAVRREELLSVQPSLREGRPVTGYSEVVGWMLLGLVIEERTGRDYREFLRERVLARSGVEADVHVSLRPEDWHAMRGRLGINLAFDEGRRQPLLSERARWVACDWNPSYGGYASARGIAGFYASLLAETHRPSATPVGLVLDAFTRAARAREHDEAFGYPCRFGLGFMVDLVDHHYGSRLSSSAFGHSGNAGMSFAFADPAASLVAAVHFNGAIAADTAVRRRRPALVNAIYEEFAT